MLIAVHLDHGMSYEVIVKVMQNGFTSIMYDGSTLPFKQNIAKTAEVGRE